VNDEQETEPAMETTAADEAKAEEELRAELEEMGALGVTLTWSQSKKGLTPAAALEELEKLRATAALTGDLLIQKCPPSKRLEIDIKAALLNAEIKRGDGLSELAAASITHAVKKRARKRERAVAVMAKGG